MESGECSPVDVVARAMLGGGDTKDIDKAVTNGARGVRCFKCGVVARDVSCVEERGSGAWGMCGKSRCGGGDEGSICTEGEGWTALMSNVGVLRVQ